MRLLAYRAETRADHGPADRMDEFFKRSDRPARDAVTRTFRDVGAECTLNTMTLTYPDQNRIVFCDPFWYFIPTEEVACHSVDGGAVLVHEATDAPGAGAARHWQRLQLLLPRWEFRQDQFRPRRRVCLFAKSFDGELCYNDDDRGPWGLFSCRKRSGGGCIVVEGKSKSHLPSILLQSRESTRCANIV